MDLSMPAGVPAPRPRRLIAAGVIRKASPTTDAPTRRVLMVGIISKAGTR